MTPRNSRWNRSAAGGRPPGTAATRARGGCWSPPTPAALTATGPGAWKAELAELSAETGLEITVCHFPPGTSKWNKIEHRLFCQLTRAWRGRPLTRHDWHGDWNYTLHPQAPPARASDTPAPP